MLTQRHTQALARGRGLMTDEEEITKNNDMEEEAIRRLTTIRRSRGVCRESVTSRKTILNFYQIRPKL
jgi:hypothetical protein